MGAKLTIRDTRSLSGDDLLEALPNSRAAQELRRLRKIEEALKKTADGVAVVPGMELWGPGSVYMDDQAGRMPRPSLSDHVVFPEEYYSTLEEVRRVHGRGDK